MGTFQPESDSKRELDDSGCVQDESPSCKKVCQDDFQRCVQLLDLSDDVLLYILKHCSPHDLKALGYTCSRLGTLIRDHSLWHTIDYRDQPCGRARLKWLLTHAVNSNTKELHLSGFARQIKGCLGYVHQFREEIEKNKTKANSSGCALVDLENDELAGYYAETAPPAGRIIEVSIRNGIPENGDQPNPPPLVRQRARFHINAQQLPGLSGTPQWPDESSSESPESSPSPSHSPSHSHSPCPGPQFTVSKELLASLVYQCPLTSLSLEYCNINCKTTYLNQLPPTLRRLSLRGVRCYNLPPHKSFLFKIHDYLPLLEYLDLSECEWLDPSGFLPLSKMPTLVQLVMRDCTRLTEFVAYASLATRYGFKRLKIFDLRGSPVADSEVSALGWLPELEELYLSPTRAKTEVLTHSHYKGEGLADRVELDPWELQEPEYFKMKECTIPDSNKRDEQDPLDLSNSEESLSPGYIRVETDHICPGPRRRHEPERDSNTHKRKVTNGTNDRSDGDPGPSPKRKRQDSRAESSQTKNTTNEGATTSQHNRTTEEPAESPENRPNADNQNADEANGNLNFVHFVRFRNNRDPVVVRERQPNEMHQRILYYNVGRPVNRIVERDIGDDSINSRSLVTDSAILRFGRSDDNIHYFHIGPHGLNDRSNGRADRSNLRILSAVGYSNITDRSLGHLAIAAPFLRSVDFRNTKVTKRGVDSFKIIRPDCEVYYGSDE